MRGECWLCQDKERENRRREKTEENGGVSNLSYYRVIHVVCEWSENQSDSRLSEPKLFFDLRNNNN